MEDYRRALELDEAFGRAKEGLATAQKRQKQVQKSWTVYVDKTNLFKTKKRTSLIEYFAEKNIYSSNGMNELVY